MKRIGSSFRRFLGLGMLEEERQELAAAVASLTAQLRREGLSEEMKNTVRPKKNIVTVPTEEGISQFFTEESERKRYFQALEKANRGDKRSAQVELEALSKIALAKYSLSELIIEAEPERGLQLSLEAARLGVIPALRRTANLYAAGIGCEPGPESDRIALKLYHAAAEAFSDPEAHFIIGSWACSGRPDGIPDWDTGFLHHKIAADAGLSKAIYNLGTHYFTGKGTPQNFTQAAACFEHAASVGNMPQAMINFANMLEIGLGRPKDPAAASFWRSQATSIDPNLLLAPDEKPTSLLKDS